MKRNREIIDLFNRSDIINEIKCKDFSGLEMYEKIRGILSKNSY